MTDFEASTSDSANNAETNERLMAEKMRAQLISRVKSYKAFELPLSFFLIPIHVFVST